MNADEWSEIHHCREQGESIKGIAQRLGMSRNTVRRALSMSTPPDDHRRRSGSVADDNDAAVRALIAATPTLSIAEIGRRVDWPHSRTLLSRKVNEIRTDVETINRTSDGATGLPQPATSFVGRRTEIAELRRLLGEHRMLSIVGPGGIGKTRLSVQVASEFRRAFPDGVRFVEFTSVRTPGMISQTLCDAMSLEQRDAHSRSADDTLIDYLRNRRMLLVLDNCEHVVDEAAELVGTLLATTSALRIIVTSREYLSIPGEYVFHLQTLPTEDETGTGAMELFERRAEAVLSGFTIDEATAPAVRTICERLDGLPLAIELACTRLHMMSVDDLADLLDRRLSLLSVGSRDRTPRHRSLQATIDWSYELCDSTERLLWERVSVFADGFDLDAATSVCADAALGSDTILDAMSSLVAKSVVLRETVDGRVRFRLLESIREYGWAHLAVADQHVMSGHLLRWCTGIIADCAAGWYGPRQLANATRIRHNRGNIRAALYSAMTEPYDEAQIAIVADALGAATFLWACGISVREHRMWLTQILDLPGVSPAAKARVFGVLALAQTLQGDRDAAGISLHRGRSIAEREKDAMTLAFVTHTAGLRDYFAGDFDAARINLDEAERGYRLLGGSPELTTTLLVHRGMLLSSVLDIDAARSAFATVFDATGQCGEQWFHSYATYGLGLVALLDDDVDTAVDLSREALRRHRGFGDTVGMTLMSDLLGWALAAQGSGSQAAVVLGAASSMWGSFGQQLYGSEHWNALRSKAIDTVRSQMTPAAFDRAWQRGLAMSTDELFAFIVDAVEQGAAQAPAAPALASVTRAMGPALSPREREVADLVARGMSNREIAEKLVLSPRTVEGHVEHVLGKLCLRRRSEVAAALAS